MCLHAIGRRNSLLRRVSELNRYELTAKDPIHCFTATVSPCDHLATARLKILLADSGPSHETAHETAATFSLASALLRASRLGSHSAKSSGTGGMSTVSSSFSQTLFLVYARSP